ncbi:MAG: nucleotide-binding protein [Promethearchaeota archaeon]
MPASDKKVISVSGKGGVGKTTFSALFLRYLIERDAGEILVVDADPDSNIPDVLGLRLTPKQTVGAIALDLKRKIEKGQLPPMQTKAKVLEGGVFGVMEEEDDFDLLVMGRAEGEGCYCYINSVLSGILDTLTQNYDITLMDMEAGLEHLSRRTDRDVDDLVIVTDASNMGMRTLDRIVELSKEVHLNFQKIWVVGNRFSDNLKKHLEETVTRVRDDGNSNVELAGFLPSNEAIGEYNLLGKSLFDLPVDNPVYLAVREIGAKIYP